MSKKICVSSYDSLYIHSNAYFASSCSTITDVHVVIRMSLTRNITVGNTDVNKLGSVA